MIIPVSAPFSGLAQALAVFSLVDQVSPNWTNTFLQQAVPYAGVIYYQYMRTSKMKGLLEDWDAKDSVVSTVFAAAGPWLALQGLAVVGFTAGGIAAGSAAAAWQASIGNVVAGSVFSSFQSMGAVGALTGGWGLAASVVGVAAYGVYKLATQPDKEERFYQIVCTLLEDGGQRNEFWQSISV
ncbi:hypothetical protein M408DRAFT_326524 [Serendipita vermifera MAFF 305830]|uniref:Uncharacterized protein n=1 Tax=Serendipita vermifera MAFF 305830 TaxID=933852 RepID=A0A0C3B7H6_SERVB|nr:hypothetical protein M408DRAFT_326524 [Serendipita vermifera MAFF 305830]